MLTRKDFIILAKMLKESRPLNPEYMWQWSQDVTAVIAACKVINPKFNSAKFREACSE